MREELMTLIQQHGLEAHAEEILAAAKPAIRLTTRSTDDDALPVGASKIGGLPDLPPELSWPCWEGNPQTLIAQVNLREIAPYDAEKLLPPSGMLYFFYDIEHQSWGYDPNDRGSWQVLYYDGNLATLLRTTPPAAAPSLATPLPWWKRLFSGATHTKSAPVEVQVLPACAVTVSGAPSIPSCDYLPDTWPDNAVDAYCELGEKLVSDDTHCLLGHPHNIQNPMEEEVALAHGGHYCGDSSGYEGSHAEALKATAQEWRLLFQVESDEHAEMMWGDAGRLYYWIRQQDLRARDFSNTWLILQCY